MKRANVYRMYKGYRICSSFFDEELKNLYEESSFLKEYFLALQERYYSLKENYPIGKAIEQKVDSVSNKSAQIAASSIQAICERQFSDAQLSIRDYDAVIRTKDKRIRIFYADFLNDPQAFIKTLAG